jgi:hypothetical protein
MELLCRHPFPAPPWAVDSSRPWLDVGGHLIGPCSAATLVSPAAPCSMAAPRRTPRLPVLSGNGSLPRSFVLDEDLSRCSMLGGDGGLRTTFYPRWQRRGAPGLPVLGGSGGLPGCLCSVVASPPAACLRGSDLPSLPCRALGAAFLPPWSRTVREGIRC